MSNPKRQLILDSALLIFAELGFDRARISDVARHAGVADGTIYNHFKSKDDLLLQLFEARVEPLVAAMELACDAAGRDASNQLRALISSYLSYVSQSPSIAALVTTHVRESHRFITDYENPPLRRFLALITNVYRRGVSAGTFRPGLSEWSVSWMVFGSLDALALAWLSRRSPDLGVLAKDGKDLAEVLVAGLRHPSVAAPDGGARGRRREEPVLFDPSID